MALGGDIAVLFSDQSEAARGLIDFLATPKAAEPWAQLGGFTSPNKRLNLDVYPDQTTRESAAVLANAETIRFDMSDLQPPAFGATPGQGMWKSLQDFLRNPTDVKGAAKSLEEARLAAK
jgi:alpha-glucoside transport system substrate-binding protein